MVQGLWGTFLPLEVAPQIQAVKELRFSGRAFLLDQCDGKLLTEMMNEEGARFAEWYYPKRYMRDFQQVLAKGLESDYIVEDSVENFRKIASVISDHYANWKNRPWWKFW